MEPRPVYETTAVTAIREVNMLIEMTIIRMTTGGDGCVRPVAELGLINPDDILSVSPGNYDSFVGKVINRMVMKDCSIVGTTNSMNEIKLMLSQVVRMNKNQSKSEWNTVIKSLSHLYEVWARCGASSEKAHGALKNLMNAYDDWLEQRPL